MLGQLTAASGIWHEAWMPACTGMTRNRYRDRTASADQPGGSEETMAEGTQSNTGFNVLNVFELS